MRNTPNKRRWQRRGRRFELVRRNQAKEPGARLSFAGSSLAGSWIVASLGVVLVAGSATPSHALLRTSAHVSCIAGNVGDSGETRVPLGAWVR